MVGKILVLRPTWDRAGGLYSVLEQVFDSAKSTFPKCQSHALCNAGFATTGMRSSLLNKSLHCLRPYFSVWFAIPQSWRKSIVA